MRHAMGMHPFRSSFVALAVVAVTAIGAEPRGRLAVDGGGLAGDLVPVAEADGGVRDTFLWQSPPFAEPLEFSVTSVAGITYPAPAARPQAAGPFVHLRGGDVIAAAVESLDGEALVVTLPGPAGPQRLRIARGEVAGITREAGGGGAYAGPAGLAGWEQSPADSWREEAGRIMTDRPRSVVTRDVSAPPRARFDIRLSRRRPTEFRIAVAADAKPADDGFVLEEVGGPAGGLMLVRRSGDRAAIEPLPADAWRGDTLRVVLFVDQERGRLAAVFPDAEGPEAGKAVEVTLRPTRVGRLSGKFRLELGGGDICLERLQVHGWQGDEPALRDTAKTTVVTRTGPLENATVTSFDAAAGAYVIARDGGTTNVPAAEIEEIRFPEPEDAGADDAAVRVVRADGGAVSGVLVRVDDAAVWLRRRGLDGPLAVPRDAIVAIQFLRPSTRRPDAGGRVGTFVAGENRVRGWLVGGADGRLAWRPLSGTRPAAFAEPVDGEVEYVARKPDRGPVEATVGGIGGIVNRDGNGSYAVVMLTEDGAAARDGRLQPGDVIVAISPTDKARFVETRDLDQTTVTHLLRGRIGSIVRLKVTDAAGRDPRQIDLPRGPISVGRADPLAANPLEQNLLEQALDAHRRLAGAEEAGDEPRERYPSLVILRNGDKVECRVVAVDAEAMLLRSPVAGRADGAAVRVPAAEVKAAELVLLEPKKIPPATFQRLLTLPRMQRDRPPTHLLRLVNGDYLRGRLLTLDEKTVTFDVLDVVKRFPREQVARIIWLHAELPKAEDEPPAVAEPEGIAARGVKQGGREDDDRQLTLAAGGVEGDTLRGRSPAFGECSIDLTAADRVLLGAAVGRDRRKPPFADWKLAPAPEPRALREREAK